MANNTFNNFDIMSNSIADQKLTAANTLTVKAWNDTITILKTQANINATYLSSLNEWLIGKDPVSIPSGDSFVDYINTYIGEMPNTVMDIVNKNSLGFTTIDIGYSTNYNIASDKELPTTKTVNKMLDGPRKDIADINEALEYKADLVDGKVPLEQLDTKETGELLVGTSTNYDTSRDDEIPTTKAVDKMLDGPRKDIADINGKLESKADLDKTGRIITSQLPSYVDDVIEGYYEEEEDKFYTDITKETEIVAETSKIYVDVNTNKTYRWSGSQYVMISQSLALGETSSTAYSGDKGKANAEAIKKLNEIVPDLLPVEITYEELKALKDNNELIAGQKYRIIDYETTTSKEKTKSVKHPFDIIVTATSENTFDENASACARKGDKYFGTWYEESLSKGAFIEGVTPSDVVPAFSIIVDSNDEIQSNYDDLKGGSDKVVELSYAKNENGDIVPVFYKNEISYIETEESPDYNDIFFYVGTEEIDGVVYDKWRKVESGGGTFDFGGESKLFVLTNIIVNPNSSTNSIIEHKGKPLDKWKIKYCFDNDKTRFEWAMPKPMIYTDDESWFERSGEIVIDGVTYYKWTSNTFNQEEYLISLTPDVEIGDGLGFLQGDYIDTLPSEAYSICLDKTNGGKGVIYHLKDENDNECPYDFKNIIFNFYFVDKDNEDNSHYKWVFAFTYFDGEKYLDGTMFTFKNNDGVFTTFINNIIKPSIEVYENIKYYRFYGNVIYHDFELNDDFIIQNNIIGGNSSWDNIIYDSVNCSIGNECNNNIINRYNNNISIGDDCDNNYIDNECYNIKIVENSYGNEINSFCENIIINGSHNILNGNCYSITMDINCNFNEFAHSCSNITLGEGCTDNEFRVICENITMGNNCRYNIFDSEKSSDITFGDYCNQNTISNSKNLKLSNTCTFNRITSSFGVYFAEKCNNNSIQYTYNTDFGLEVIGFHGAIIRINNSTIGNGVKNISVNSVYNITNSSRYYSINIKDGVQGASDSSKLQVYIPKHNEEAIQSQITIDQDQKGQILMYWNDDKLKKVGYYLESKTSTEWLPLPEEDAGGGMSEDTYKQKYQEVLWLGSDELPLLPTDLTSLPSTSVSSLLTNMKAIWSDIHVDIVELYGYDRVVFLAYVDSIKKIVKCTIRYQESNSTYVLNVHSSIYKKNVKECISLYTNKRYQLFRDNSSSYVNSLNYYLTEISGYSKNEVDNKLYGVIRPYSKTVNIINKNDDNTIYFDDIINTYLPIRIEINGFYYFLIKEHDNTFKVYDEENDEQIEFPSFFDAIVIGGYTTDNEMCINPNYLSDNCVVDVVYYEGYCSTRYEI